MTYQQPSSRCDRTANTCPSRNNCHRYTLPRSEDYPAAALNHRREAGDSACDCYQPINEPLSTYRVEMVANAFGLDPELLEEVN